MHLDRYHGESPKFRVLRRQEDGSYKEVPAFDYFVLALKDRYATAALAAYALAAEDGNDDILGVEVRRLWDEARQRTDRKTPD